MVNVSFRKGQISMNMIVYVAIALFVLVLIVAFATGGIGKGFKGLTTTGPGALDTLKSKCTASCNQAKALVDSSGTDSWKTTTYCSEQYGFDSNGDGSVDDTEFLNCWESPISVKCSTTVSIPSSGTKLLSSDNPDADIVCPASETE